MTTFSPSLTDLTALLPQSRACSCYVSRPILAPPLLWMQKHYYLGAQDFAHSSDWWHQPRLDNVTCAWSWRFCGPAPAITSDTPPRRTVQSKDCRAKCRWLPDVLLLTEKWSGFSSGKTVSHIQARQRMRYLNWISSRPAILYRGADKPTYFPMYFVWWWEYFVWC